MDALVVPTVPTTFTVKELAEDPIGRNRTLGHYTTFANLLDLAAISVPAGMTAIGRPHGITLLGPARSDALLAGAAAAFHALAGGPAVHTNRTAAPVLAVIGAHRTGQPLHDQLIALGAQPLGTALTAPAYRMYALKGSGVPKPGLVRTPGDGVAVEVELFGVSTAALGSLLTQISPPLGLGAVELSDGRTVHGFLCEAYAVADAADISGHGSWLDYLEGAHAQ
jgi:allophanate hydrolase